MNRQKNRLGFTLIELLVVVAIIAVLMGILIPSLASAKKNAQTSVCLSNMKQLGVGTLMYHQENNYLYPYPTTGINDKTGWFTALDGYLGPLSRDNPDAGGSVGDRNFRKFKQCPVWASITTAYPSASESGSTSNQTIQQYSRTIKMNVNLHRKSKTQGSANDIENPVNFVVFGDGLATDTLPWGIKPYGDTQETGGMSFDVVNPGGGISSPSLRHAGGANISFADGHAELVKLKTKTRTITTIGTGMLVNVWQSDWLLNGKEVTGSNKLTYPVESVGYTSNPNNPYTWSVPGRLYQ